MSRAIIVIPARDEAHRLPAALASCRISSLAAVVVANGCSDATAVLSRDAGAFVIETPALEGGVGEARLIGLAAALEQGAEVLLTMDADCTLAPGSVAAVMRALDHADAVFGRVAPDAAEFARLPETVRRHGMSEDRRDGLRALIDSATAACPWNPFPAHAQSPGALIAWHASVYRSVGGIDPVPCHEDRRMAAALARHDFRIARPWDAVSIASCRLRGRAPGGMADTIAARARAGRRLIAETHALERECAALERRLSDLVPRSDWPQLPSTPTIGDDHVSPFQQASV